MHSSTIYVADLDEMSSGLMWNLFRALQAKVTAINSICAIFRKKVIDEEQHAELKIPGTETLGGGVEVICGK